jgi:glyoxylase-like metal-dependent hydrolase (beta-lactamase superfamily II)
MRIHTFARGPFQTNTYLIEDETTGEALLVDPTMDSEDVADEIAERKLHVALIVNTHGHVDHVYGDAFFKRQTGAGLAIHATDVALLAGCAQQARMFGLATPAAAQADRLLADGDDIAFGASELLVIHTPGHTPGGICLYGDGVLIAGDTLFAGSIGRSDLPGGDGDLLIESIQQRLLVLPDSTVVYSGHGESTTIGAEKRSNPFL